MEKLQENSILYEDNHILVVKKPVNMPVCADDSHDINLLDELKLYLKEKYNKPGNVYLGLVHRLDRPVSGVMVFAKTSKAASRLSAQVRDNILKKTYYAVVEGTIPESGQMVDYMKKDEKKNISYVTNSNDGKKAILDYVVTKRKDNLNLVKINLVTGRSHQIRVQMSSRGYPLVGDQKYNKNAKKGVNVALFAKILEFEHPVKKEKMKFEIELPNCYPFSLLK